MSRDTSVLRAGIAGAGLMGRWHARYATRLGAQVCAVLDSDPEQARALAARSRGNPRQYEEFGEMLEAANLDVLHLCTPLEHHFHMAMAAVSAGVNVLVEKPLAASAAETRDLLQAAESRGVLVCPVHQFGFQAGAQLAQHRFGSLGTLRHVRFFAASAGSDGRETVTPDEVVADILPHPLSVLQALLPTSKLDTRGWSGTHPDPGELQVTGQLGAAAIDLTISMSARPTRCEMDLFFSSGRIFLNFFHGYSIVQKGGVSRGQKIIQPFGFAFRELLAAGYNLGRRALRGESAYPGLPQLMARFYRAVLDDGEPPIAPEASLELAQAREELTQRFLPAANAPPGRPAAARPV